MTSPVGKDMASNSEETLRIDDDAAAYVLTDLGVVVPPAKLRHITLPADPEKGNEDPLESPAEGPETPVGSGSGTSSDDDDPGPPPVEGTSPLGYGVGFMSAFMLNISQMIGARI